MRMVVGAVMAMAVLMVFLNADAECFLYYFFFRGEVVVSSIFSSLTTPFPFP